MDWIDKLNKELEERRNLNQTSEEKEKAEQRKRSWTAAQGGYAQGPIQGKENVESGHWSNIQSLGGKAQGPIQGKKNAESGHLDNIRQDGIDKFLEKYLGTEEWSEWSSKGGKAQSEKEYTCPKCGKVGKGNAMIKHHFDNCGKNPILEIVDEVVVAEWQCLQDIADEYGYSPGQLSGAVNGKKKGKHPHLAYGKKWYRKNKYTK